MYLSPEEALPQYDRLLKKYANHCVSFGEVGAMGFEDYYHLAVEVMCRALQKFDWEHESNAQFITYLTRSLMLVMFREAQRQRFQYLVSHKAIEDAHRLNKLIQAENITHRQALTMLKGTAGHKEQVLYVLVNQTFSSFDSPGKLGEAKGNPDRTYHDVLGDDDMRFEEQYVRDFINSLPLCHAAVMAHLYDGKGKRAMTQRLGMNRRYPHKKVTDNLGSLFLNYKNGIVDEELNAKVALDEQYFYEATGRKEELEKMIKGCTVFL